MKALKLSLVAATAVAMVGGISISQAVAEQPTRHGSYADRDTGTWGYYAPRRYDYYDRYGHYDRRYYTYGYAYDPYYYDRWGYYDHDPGLHFGFGTGFHFGLG